MKTKIITFVLALFFSGMVLLVSLFSSSSLNYKFDLQPGGNFSTASFPDINYHLPFPGRIQPINVLWPIKVIRDKLVLSLTVDKLEKAKVALLLADKRLASGAILVEQGRYEEASEVFRKSQIYLDYSCRLVSEVSAQTAGATSFVHVLNLASLKHREVLEKSITRFPEDARPIINEVLDGPKLVFEKSSQILNERESKPSENPFGD